MSSQNDDRPTAEANEKMSQKEGAMIEDSDRGRQTPAANVGHGELRGATRTLHGRTTRDYLQDLEDFARQHPRITAGVSAFLGWKIGRALKFFK